MNQKVMAKIGIDFLMTVLLICLMAYQITGELLHEWIGAGIFILFIAHHALNFRWYQNIAKGKYAATRVANTVLDLLVMIAMLGLMVSSAILSQYIFTFLSIRGGMVFARTAHLLCSYWGLVLMSLHLGLHWSMISGMIKKLFSIKKAPMALRVLAKATVLVIAGYGIYAFISEHIADYLFLRTQFVMFDYEASAATIFTQYIAMMILFAAIAYYIPFGIKRLGIRLLRSLTGCSQEE